MPRHYAWFKFERPFIRFGTADALNYDKRHCDYLLEVIVQTDKMRTPPFKIANGGKELKDVVERERTTRRSTARSIDKPAAALHCIIDH